MGIKGKRRVFIFDDLNLKTLSPTELADLKRPQRLCPCCHRPLLSPGPERPVRTLAEKEAAVRKLLQKDEP